MSDKNKNSNGPDSHPVTRRGFLRVGALTLGALAVPYWVLRQVGAREEKDAGTRGGRDTATTSADSVSASRRLGVAASSSKAKSVIQIWLAGGPPHTDTFDPKPQSGDDYAGPYKKPVQTNVPGIVLCEMLPLLAKHADKYSIIRSMTHPDNGHETAAYIVQTGTLPTKDLVYPAMGAVVALKKGYEAGYAGSLPPYITLTSPLGRFTEAGFLGLNYQTFPTGGDPMAEQFFVQGLVPARGLTPQRIQQRRDLLKSLDTLAIDDDNDETLHTMDSYQDKAFGLIGGDAKKAFDLSGEKADLRDRYGRNRWGQSCLMARRLVENGVPYITVNWGGWDTHSNHFQAMAKMLPQLDAALATLLEDLADRSLLGSTIVQCIGEFGRTPKIANEPPWNGGRHHFAAAFSCLIAGGGFKGGAVVGSTDARGEKVRDRPVYPWDLAASMYKLLGIDPMSKLPHPRGCTAYVTPLASGDVPTGGMLKEIM